MTVGKLFHVTHASDALGPLDAWYDRVLQPWHGMMEQQYAAREHRVGSLLVVGDAVVETVAPAGEPGAASAPIGRFLGRFGRHWHSLAWYCDDVGEMWDRLSAAGVRVYRAGGTSEGRPAEGDVYTHPKDTGTQLELYQPPAADGGPQGSGRFPDPRFAAGWPQRWRATGNALGIDRLAYVTVLVADLRRAAAAWRDGLGATPIHEGRSAAAGTSSLFFAVGPETVVELATPTRADGLAGRDLAEHGDVCHSVAFHVADPASAAGHLGELGIGMVARDEATILADPADTFGAPYRFTAWQVPGDPRR